jgi:hypothetical protein
VPPQDRDTCAFCGLPFGPRGSARQKTGEDALPKWLLGVMPGEGSLTYTRQAVHGGPLRVWTNKELAIVARQVCKKCNNGWMSDLENRAKPVLTRIMHDVAAPRGVPGRGNVRLSSDSSAC